MPSRSAYPDANRAISGSAYPVTGTPLIELQMLDRQELESIIQAWCQAG